MGSHCFLVISVPVLRPRAPIDVELLMFYRPTSARPNCRRRWTGDTRCTEDSEITEGQPRHVAIVHANHEAPLSQSFDPQRG